MKKIFLSWRDVQKQTAELCRQITLSDWRPEYVVGITRGGLVPANLISQYFEVRMETLKVSLRDDSELGPESNLWMAEDAYEGKNILIIDDINDTGETLNWIKKDWESFHPSKPQPWKTIWNQSVRVATLYNNDSSKSKLDVDYSAVDINKQSDPVWLVFPWEEWWK
jgi:hypoxanthine phosphoribosyltransferase